MSRSTDTQHSKRGHNVQMDIGTVLLGTGGTATVYTVLNRVWTVVASPRGGLGSAALQISARTSAAAPYFTITDPAGILSSGRTVNYIALGN